MNEHSFIFSSLPALGHDSEMARQLNLKFLFFERWSRETPSSSCSSFPDFFIKYKDKDSNIRRSVIEVKPMRETLQPKATKGKSRKTMINESMTYVKNQAKWKAAREFCEDRKLEFKIMTEKELGIR